MKKITIASALGIALASNIAIAKVELQVDDNIKVTAINGQEIRHGLLQPLQKTFNLEAGRHVITARYDRLFDISNSDHDYLKSDNITISADLADNQQYQLIMPNQPNNYNAAKEYAKAPTLAIAHNGNIIAQESTAQSRTGLLSGLTGAIGNMFGRDNQAVNSNQQAIAAINQPPKTTNTANKDNLDGFMQLWLNASEEEREKIRQWIQK